MFFRSLMTFCSYNRKTACAHPAVPGLKQCEKHADAAAKALLKHCYGITFLEFSELLRKQNGLCAVCQTSVEGKTKPTKTVPRGRALACVDHSHVTGKVRGLLCNYCNLAAGYVKDSPDIARKLADYLE